MLLIATGVIIVTTKFLSNTVRSQPTVIGVSGSNVNDLPKPMISRGNARHCHSQSERSNFCAIEEVGPQEADRDEEIEQEDEQNADNLSSEVGLRERSRHGQSHHTTCHSGAADHQCNPAAKSVDREERHETREKLPCESATRENPCRLRFQPETLLENDSGVYRDKVASRHLLKELQQNTYTETIQQLVLSHFQQPAK